MRTTVDIPSPLLRRAKREALDRESSLSQIVEQALHRYFSQKPLAAFSASVHLPVSKRGGGLQPGIDLDDTASLLGRLDALP